MDRDNRRDRGSSGGGVRSGSLISVKGLVITVMALFIVITAAVTIPKLLIKQSGTLTILYPQDGTLFPPDISSPTIKWKDSNRGVGMWELRIEFSDGSDPFIFKTKSPRYRPVRALWERIKRRTLNSSGRITVEGIVRAGFITRRLSHQSVSFSTSMDSVKAPIIYRDVPLPFIYAYKNLELIRWRLGQVSSDEIPPVVFGNIPVCGNCHSFSSDGRVLGMDVDYANDKGSYAIARVEGEIVLSMDKIITWSDYRREDRELTFGLLSQISPDGRYAISTVKDRSIFVPKDDIEYSQLFFPIKGILVVYDIEKKRFWALPGADNRDYVQSNPTWSPDGKYIVFARAPAYRNEKLEQLNAPVIGTEFAMEFIEGRRDFKYDLYRIPFNGGRGGRAEPIRGASNNGMSNYFPRISPDGRWLVFCKAKNFMLLQPDSKLYIMPAEGGIPRKMSCNTSNMNSWHSWSPSGRWLVFSSKEEGPYTQLYLTHIDEHGNDTPPVLLDRFLEPERAANIPEFVNIDPARFKRIVDAFSDSSIYLVRMANLKFDLGDREDAIKLFQRAMKVSPPNDPYSFVKCGIFLGKTKNWEKVLEYANKAIEMDRNYPKAYSLRGLARLQKRKVNEALGDFNKSIKLDPQDAMTYFNRALAHYILGNYESALKDVKKCKKLGGNVPQSFIKNLNKKMSK